ncbi:uncharacterized protein LOC5510065 [Nematostella vectensis]|uniref:uncharacterized protein LOC5510065 n=1 Tax=Nematostella vectensis TaxID=45351 RepID=UPI002076E359|nr:uncharacterized protein LOC5510065 [Nematostella vectensis]
MRFICAGLSKTGTKSLVAALRYLGYTVYDIEENWRYHMDEWIKAFQGTNPDFTAMYASVDTAIDLPPYLFVRDILVALPELKVILTVRENAEEWLTSLTRSLDIWWSVYNQRWLKLARVLTPTGRKWATLIRHQTAALNTLDYTRHIEEVKAIVPADRLLVFNVKEGWEPLCAFLGHEAPSIPFPHRNKKSEFIPDMINKSSIVARMRMELTIILSCFVLIIGICLILLF